MADKINTYNPSEPPSNQVGTIPLGNSASLLVRTHEVPIDFIHLWVQTRIARYEESGRETQILSNYRHIRDLLVSMNPGLRDQD